MLTFSACHSRKQVVSDATLQRLQEAEPGISEACLNKIRYGGIDAMPKRTEDCFVMEPARVWKGLWLDEFEGSRFCPDATKRCTWDMPGDRIWLTIEKRPPSAGIADPRLYAIEFIGRKTKFKGHYGHMGVYDQEIVVDRILSIRPVDR